MIFSVEIYKHDGSTEKMYVKNKFVIRHNGPEKISVIINAYKKRFFKKENVEIPLTRLVDSGLAIALYDDLVEQAGVFALYPVFFKKLNDVSCYDVPFSKLKIENY